MLYDHHKTKIVDVDQLIRELGEKKRARLEHHLVVMCCGVFDIVHPGHVRHLLYAKSKGDVLVVGVTSDRYVYKGPHRPHAPQDLRAANLAVMDMVDYVIIYDDERPDNLIAAVKPDIYAKGFEYSETARPGRTISETKIVESYGGKMLFTPGDVVFSSSKIIEETPPNLQYDKLKMVMERGDVTFTDLERTIRAMDDIRVHVVGDIIVDRYTTCTLIGGQTENPAPSVAKKHSEDFVGGAGIVAAHLAAAGADVKLTTVVGDDRFRYWLAEQLRHSGVAFNLLVDETRPTTLKESILVNGQKLIKIDDVDNSSISDALLESLCEDIKLSQEHEAVIFSDFRHGIFNSRTTPRLIESIPEDALKVADSQVASRWGNILDFKSFDIITPNEREARFALADQDSGIRPLASKLYDQADCQLLILKMDERGLMACRSPDHESPDSFFSIDSFASDVKDTMGAGDVLLAYSTLSHLARGKRVRTRSAEVSVIIGAMAAAVACETEGNKPVQPEYVLAKLKRAEEELS